MNMSDMLTRDKDAYDALDFNLIAALTRPVL